MLREIGYQVQEIMGSGAGLIIYLGAGALAIWLWSGMPTPDVELPATDWSIAP